MRNFNFFRRKEKRTFEKYQKAARALPDKKDREEIEMLKNQVNLRPSSFFPLLCNKIVLSYKEVSFIFS